MYYSEIKTEDVANGPGVRTTIYVSGCPHHCKGCFNRETWDYTFGEKFSDRTIKEILSAMDRPFIQGLTLLGGEPLAPENQLDVLRLVSEVKKAYPSKDIWCFTGYLFDKDIMDAPDRLSPYTKDIIKMLDVLVDGPFIESQKNLMLKFKGSENQRTIDVQKSLKNNRIELLF